MIASRTPMPDGVTMTRNPDCHGERYPGEAERQCLARGCTYGNRKIQTLTP